MAELFAVRLPKEMSAKLESLAEEEDVDKSTFARGLIGRGIKEKELEKALGLYADGKITLWKAARLAGISLWKMIEVARERKIEAQYGPRELEEDLRALRA